MEIEVIIKSVTIFNDVKLINVGIVDGKGK